MRPTYASLYNQVYVGRRPEAVITKDTRAAGSTAKLGRLLARRAVHLRMLRCQDIALREPLRRQLDATARKTNSICRLIQRRAASLICKRALHTLYKPGGLYVAAVVRTDPLVGH